MHDLLGALLLGTGTGAAYALLATGIVAIHKGSGVLNFAQGGVAMFAAYCYVALLDAGMPTLVALISVLLGAAAFGASVAAGILRPLRTAPALARVVATLGLLLALQGLAMAIWGVGFQVVPSLFPTDPVVVGGVSIGVNRLYMLGCAVVVAVLLWAGFRYTRWGLATQAASENEKAAALLGFSPNTIAALNWALGCVLAAFAGVLIAPITSLDAGTMPLLVLPALAAALVGRFASFWWTTLAAFAIAGAQSWLAGVTEQPGVRTAAPLLVVILVMVIAGKAVPGRGSLSQRRPPQAPVGGSRLVPVVLGVLAVVVLYLSVDLTYTTALTTSLITAVLALSLVVVTGYVGQISLMQLTFAGLAGYLTAQLATLAGVPFPVSIIVAALAVAPIGALLGLPSLRVRGVSLAIVTMAAAGVINDLVFANQEWTGGVDGLQVPTAAIGAFSLDPYRYPERYGVFVLLVLVGVAILVGNLRRSGTGRQMIAVRSNERAAVVAGVNVAAVKLQAFTLAAVIAGLAGGLMAYSNPFLIVGGGEFDVLPSIMLLTFAYIAGIASVPGAVVAGLAGSGGIVYVLLSEVPGFAEHFVTISGLALLVTVIVHPDGVAPFIGARIYQPFGNIRGGPRHRPEAGQHVQGKEPEFR